MPRPKKSDTAENGEKKASMSERLDNLEGYVGKIVRSLEKVLGIDVDRDGKVGFVLKIALPVLCILMLAIGVLAQSFVLRGTDDSTTFQVDKSGNTTVGGTLGVTGAMTLTAGSTASGAFTIDGLAALGQSDMVVTNGEQIAVGSSHLRLAHGSATVITNTVAAPTAAGQILIISAHPTNAANMVLTETGNFNIAGATETFEPRETMMFIAVTATNWAEVSNAVPD